MTTLRFLADRRAWKSKPCCCPISGLEAAGGHPLLASLREGLKLPAIGAPVRVCSGWEPMLAAWQALCWEKLHTGNWKEVGTFWPAFAKSSAACSSDRSPAQY
jgi:hypothetical protein